MTSFYDIAVEFMMHCVKGLFSIHSFTTSRSFLRFSIFGDSLINAATFKYLMLLFLSLNVSFFLVSTSLLSCRLHIFCMLVASSTLIHSGGLAGSMANSSSTVDGGDPPPFPVVQYIERYRACLDGRQSATMRLAADDEEICDV